VERQAGFESARNHLALRAAFFLSAGVVLAFIAFPTIDHDEGFFALLANHFWTRGHMGFAWTDLFFGRGEMFFPLNSITPLLNLAPAYWWESALFWGRMTSAACVLAGQFVLIGMVIDRIPSTGVRWLIALSWFSSLPLWLSARMIRPDAAAFLAVVLVLKFSLDRRTYLSDFSAGIFAGLAFLAHNIHGCFAILLLACVIFATAGRQAFKRLAAAAAGTALIAGGFFLWYGMHVGFASLLQQVSLFARFTPRTVTGFSPAHHLAAWVNQVIGQANWMPLLGIAALALLFPLPLPKSPARTIVLALKLAIFLELLVWVFVYPRKALSPACFLLPVAITALSLAWQNAPRPSVNRFAMIALSVLLLGNLLLSIRYHARLFKYPKAVESLAPVRTALQRSGALDSDHPQVLSKLWLSFVLPGAVSTYDVTLFPVMERYGYSGPDSLADRLSRMDAAVLEWDGHQFIDDMQVGLADFYRQRGWHEMTVSAPRYFMPGELIIFTRPEKPVPEKPR
jgi:hypothetical protein